MKTLYVLVTLLFLSFPDSAICQEETTSSLLTGTWTFDYNDSKSRMNATSITRLDSVSTVRLARIESERLAKIERERLARIERQRLAKLKLQSDYMNTIVDHEIPILVETKKNYFFFVSKINTTSVNLSKFHVYANKGNELPYKVDMVREFKARYDDKNVCIYGPYKNEFSRDMQYNLIRDDGLNSHISVDERSFYLKNNKFDEDSSSTTDNNKYDFWGNIKTNTKKEPNPNPKSELKPKSNKGFWD